MNSGCTGFLSSSQNSASQRPLSANGAGDDCGEELDLDVPGEPIPAYAEADLEEWSSHMTSTERNNIHWLCQQSPSLALLLEEDQRECATQSLLLEAGT
eukprot:1064254-Rhodomonas_salina.1